MVVARRLAHFSPGKVIILSLFGIILLGALCLSLPAARLHAMPFIDLVFTSTSSLCVTGLFVIPLEHFTPFGHSIILTLMQIGGLGLITLTIFLLSLFVELGFTMQLMVGKLLDLETWKGIKRLLVTTMMATIVCELLGTLCFLPTFAQDHSIGHALFLAFFHSVSSFCNAGITLLDTSLIPYQHNYFFLLTTIFLILLGGLGFVTWNEGIYYLQTHNKKKRYSFSLHSKIIIYASTVFILLSTLLIFATEYHHAFHGMGPLRSLFYAAFHAISFRSAGFLCVPLNSFYTATLLLYMSIAFIGSSPSSTGSGVKITTFVVFLMTLKATILGKTSIDMYGRHIPDEQVHKATTIISLSILWILCITFLLLLSQEHGTFFQLLLETTSAFTNLGTSQGITPLLSNTGKLLIMASMIAGRIGSLALILAVIDLAYKRNLEKIEFSYPEERIMLG